MKVIFAGPSLFGADVVGEGIELRPPARQGDILSATLQGATVIGLIDGNFDGVGAVWHKEILHALSLGIAVFGAASMGALRAAECAAFGMVPVGRIATLYASGALDDDAAVALVSAPEELDHMPLTEPLVDVVMTLDRLSELGVISGSECRALTDSARRLFFKERTVDAIISGASAGGRIVELQRLYGEHRVRQKQADALELIARVGSEPDIRRGRPAWQLERSPYLEAALRNQPDPIGV